MPTISRIENYDLEGFQDLSNPGVPYGSDQKREAELMQPFSAKLLVLHLDAKDDGFFEILSRLEAFNNDSTTHVFAHDQDGKTFVVVCERTSDGGDRANLHEAFRMAKVYCEQSQGKTRRLYSAQELKKEFTAVFDAIVRKLRLKILC